MDDIVNNLERKMKTRLHEVADLLLEVYRTLVRMRYLDEDCIQLGPHDVHHLIPMYRSHSLDDSIIYLYSILPYVTSGPGDFFDRGEFVCFLDPDTVAQGRDPFYMDGPPLKPWMTPLSGCRNHSTALIYSAKTHDIWIFNQMDLGSVDPALQMPPRGESDADVDHEEAGASSAGSDVGIEERDDEDESQLHNNSELEESEGRSNSGDEEVDDCSEAESSSSDEESQEGAFVYDKSDCRPAGDVLRDIAKWYHELKELPGGGENSGLEWEREVIEGLYQKHGWPDSFDGDGFLIDQARICAALNAKR